MCIDMLYCIYLHPWFSLMLKSKQCVSSKHSNIGQLRTYGNMPSSTLDANTVSTRGIDPNQGSSNQTSLQKHRTVDSMIHASDLKIEVNARRL